MIRAVSKSASRCHHSGMEFTWRAPFVVEASAPDGSTLSCELLLLSRNVIFCHEKLRYVTTWGFLEASSLANYQGVRLHAKLNTAPD